MRWACDIAKWRPSGAEWARALSLVAHQPTERERIGRFVYKRDAKASLVGQLMVRKAIRDALQVPNESVLLERTDRGKPYLPASTGLDIPFRFNVSHQGSYAVLAASPTAQLLGVDVMRIDRERFLPGLDGSSRLADFFHTMRRQFTPGEWKNIRGQPQEAPEVVQLANFYRHWCLKESYVKALGVGIGMDLQSLDFAVAEWPLRPASIVTSTALCVSGRSEPSWRFEEQLLDDDHCVCVALGGAEQVDRPAEPFQVIQVSELLPAGHSWPADEEEQWARDFECKDEAPTLFI